MKEKHDKINRRNFLKTIGAAGLGSVFASSQLKADPNEPNAAQKAEGAKFPELPRRKLGKTGIEIPILSNGLMFDITENQLILRANLQHNVTYWDTASGYFNGTSEIGIGTFLGKNPEVRKKLFIVTKASRAYTPEDVEARLQESLKRMNTDYIDLYYGVHGCDNPDSQLTAELQKWAEGAKKRKLIRYFGFSTHKNMEKCLMAASKLKWIDAIMTTCNVSVMQNQQMQEAIQACSDAGVGLIAMKVLLGVQKKQAEAEDRMVTHFLDKGYTREQALIKAVLEDKRITAACLRMENVTLLRSNVAAVLDKTSLTQADTDVLKKYAAESCGGYCAGCADICDAALPNLPYTSDIMRYLMYYNSYGNRQEARELFAQIPSNVRNELLNTDYSLAEARCPQRLPIGKLVAEAVGKLA
ncbi:MAG: aldo/keto reductase [Phycisphaerae bacterium]|nr:aldo/keto reductase [Phycisphaerae bacterium]MDD5381144.1 aldo/keto reductase [Phycisphaerae bacterium]